jgi:3-keto-disaccharide hydrolase
MRRVFAIASITIGIATALSAQQANPFLGAWNMTGTGQDAAYVYWLEVKDDGSGKLSGMFLNRSGNPNPLAVVKVENGELIFQGGRPDQPTGPEYRARFEGGKLIGHHTVTSGARAATAGQPAVPGTQREVNWIGVRPPVWPPANANGRHTYGTPVVLFDGKSLDAFGVQNPNRPLGWSVADGVAANEPSANNLVSKEKFKDFKIEAEYKLGEHSNSGIYLRGRYELQLLDDATDTQTRRDLAHMAIYGRTPPTVNASKPANEWQRMEAILVGNRVTVTLNGTRVQDNAVILGITGGALDNDELAPGPIMIQGDHTGVWLRKVIVTPITKAG